MISPQRSNIARAGVGSLWPPRSTFARAGTGSLWPLGAYLLVSIVLFGLPVLGHFGSQIIASNPVDPSAFMWFYAWWPHALLHGLNPFVTHAIFVPEGYNLVWSDAMPGPSIVLAPVTLAFGPAVTWNVLQLCAPALSAWTGFLLCRHVTGRQWPSLLGGYVFGFSPYLLENLTGTAEVVLVAILPVFVLLVLRRVQGSIGRRRFVVAMTLAIVAQYLISSEVLASATLFGTAALVLAYALFGELRATLRDAVKLLAGAYLASAVLISPFLYFFFFGQQYPPTARGFSADLASFVLPPPLVAAGRHGTPFAGANTQSYLGLPLLAIVALVLWQQRRNRAAWLIALSLLVAAVASIGAHVHWRGSPTSIPAPWLALTHVPVLEYALPIRFAVYVALPMALIVAMWLSRKAASRRSAAAGWALGLLALASILPDIGSSAWSTHISDPAFFRTGAYRAYLKPSDHVLTMPAWGENERWQADAGFRFELAAGYAGSLFPDSYTRYPTWTTLLTGQLTSDYATELRRFIAAKNVTAIVLDERAQGPWTTLFGTLGVRPVAKGGVLLYRLVGST